MPLHIDELSNIKENKNYYKIFFNNKTIKLWTPYMNVPFGFENNYKKYLLKLEFADLKKNTQMIHIYNFIKVLEEYIIETFDIKKENLRSIIREKDNFNHLITVKFLKRGDKILTKVTFENTDDYLKTIYELGPNEVVKCLLEIKKVWIYPKSDEKIAGLMVYIKELHVK